MHLPRFRARTWQTNSVCRRCNLISFCSSCPSAAEMENGDVEKLVPQFCEITHRRAYALQGDACGHRADASCRHPDLTHRFESTAVPGFTFEVQALFS